MSVAFLHGHYRPFTAAHGKPPRLAGPGSCARTTLEFRQAVFGQLHAQVGRTDRIRKGFSCRNSLLDQAWGTHVNAQELATNIFSTSIFPYAAFLYFLTKSKKTPPLALFGFYFLLVFVFATIPAGIVALKVYKKSLANVDWLHGSAESMLTLTNLFIVLGLRQGIRQAEAANKSTEQPEKQSEIDSATSVDAR